MTNSFPVNVIQLGVKFQKVHWIFIKNSLGQKQKNFFSNTKIVGKIQKLKNSF